tara:strand:- start:264 stop:521 length:258 start_codon:yes stop_codon:yes gene_type:complete
MDKTKTKLPKWFNGEIYDKGDTVTNSFSGQSYELTAEELSMYDFIMGANALFEAGIYNKSLTDDMQKGLRWFTKNNVEAYMVLLD